MNIVFSLAYFSLKVQVFLSIFIKKLTICIFSVKFTYFLLLPNFDDKFNSMLKQKKTPKGGILFKISPMATTGLAALTLHRLRRLNHKFATGIHV